LARWFAKLRDGGFANLFQAEAQALVERIWADNILSIKKLPLGHLTGIVRISCPISSLVLILHEIPD
jgi:hypothetical protein